MSFSRDISLVALANTLLWIVFPPRFDGEGKKKSLNRLINISGCHCVQSPRCLGKPTVTYEQWLVFYPPSSASRDHFPAADTSQNWAIEGFAASSLTSPHLSEHILSQCCSGDCKKPCRFSWQSCDRHGDLPSAGPQEGTLLLWRFDCNAERWAVCTLEPVGRRICWICNPLCNQ